MLAGLGVARTDMRLITARDLVCNSNHAVLVAQLGGRSVMLDNVTDRLLDGSVPNDYLPIMSFTKSAKWVHDYTVQQSANVRIASLSAVAAQKSGQANGDVSASAKEEFSVVSFARLSAVRQGTNTCHVGC